jgi:ATP-dependent RNA helicase RhlE
VIELLNGEVSHQPSALVLLPTRELAMQVEEQYEQLRSSRLRKAALIVGGVPEKAQIQAVQGGASLIIATPGRLQDFLDRNLINLRKTKILVLDEADRMLDMVSGHGLSWTTARSRGCKCIVHFSMSFFTIR